MRYILWVLLSSLPILLMFGYVQSLSESIRNHTLRGGGMNEKEVRRAKENN